jgi:hypothetical protein
VTKKEPNLGHRRQQIPVNSFRSQYGDGFLERLGWHVASGVVAAVLVLVVQGYISAGQASATTARVSTLESQTQQELVGIHRELERMNATLEKLAGR